VVGIHTQTAAEAAAAAAAEWEAASPVQRVIISLRKVNPLVYMALFIAIKIFRSYSSATKKGKAAAANGAGATVERISGREAVLREKARKNNNKK